MIHPENPGPPTEAEELLRALVEGLEATYWSSWQGTYKFAQHLERASEFLARQELRRQL